MQERNLDVSARSVKDLIASGNPLEGVLPLRVEIYSVNGNEPRERIVEQGWLEQVLDASVCLFEDE